MANFPASLDDGTSLPNPSAVNKTNSPSHAGLHDAENAAIIAAETKLGTGASTPTVSKLLFGTGTGTSAWTQLTSAQLAASLSDETGTGLTVFGTTPTLITPKIDTINESTPGNGTTIGGVNVKSGALVTSNSVVTANITNASVTPDKLSSAGSQANITTGQSQGATSYGDMSSVGPSVTVTIGANGLALIIITAQLSNNNLNSFTFASFVASGANTIAASDLRAALQKAIVANDDGTRTFTYLATGLTPGSTTFKMQYRVSGGTATIGNRYISVIPL